MNPDGSWRFEDWRAVEPPALEPLYRAECARWRAALCWDYAASCEIVEAARRAGTVPGLVARRDDGTVAAWTFFAPYEGVLQVGALVGDGDASCRALLGATLASRDATTVRAISCFLYPQSPQLAVSFAEAGFLVERHFYLGWDLRAGTGARWVPPAGLSCGQDPGRDVAAAATLLRRSYGGSREGSCFAPDGLPHQWEHYVSGLLLSGGCGHYLPGASLDLREAGGELVGITLVSRVSDETAHLSQVAVDPARRGAGLGKALVEESCRMARGAGFQRMTLLVAESNRAALDLYARLGFRGDQAFLHAVRG